MKFRSSIVKCTLSIILVLLMVVTSISAVTVFAEDADNLADVETDVSVENELVIEETPSASETQKLEEEDIAQTGANIVTYCKNSKNWSSVNAYCWNGSGGEGNQNAAWPGKPMTDIGDNVWEYKMEKNWENIIFNGSGDQTADLVFPGSGKIYDLATGKWDDYSTSALKILSFKTDAESPQYKGSQIIISADATSDCAVQYKFSLTPQGGSTTVLSNFSSTKQVEWIANTEGNYTITLDVKDVNGNALQRTLTFRIDDDSKVSAPIIKSVTPITGSYIQKGKVCNIAVTASGGKVGTNLLFYKYTVQDQNSKTVNVPYYTRNSTYSFTPSVVGTYKVTVSVQNSENDTVVKEVDLESVTDVPTDDLKISSFTTSGSTIKGGTITASVTATGGKSPYTYKFIYAGSVVKDFSSVKTCNINLTETGTFELKVEVKDSQGNTASKSMNIVVTNKDDPETRTLKGDSDRNGKVEIVDATRIQQLLAKIIGDAEVNKANADVDDNNKVEIVDATYIQQKLAGMNPIIW